MVEDNEAKTSFIIDHFAYCYKVMMFGLKNAGATYQWLVDKNIHTPNWQEPESQH